MHPFMKINDCVLADHRSIKELIADFKSEYSSPEGKFSAFRVLSFLVEAHAKAEESSLLDFARGETDLRTQALESLEEHVLTDELLTKIRTTEDLEVWEAKARVYCDLLQQHMEKEERGLFLEIDARLTEEESSVLAQHYMQLRAVSLGLEGGELNQSQLSFIEGLLNPLYSETGRIGYMIAWILGVPAWLLLIVILMRGH